MNKTILLLTFSFEIYASHFTYKSYEVTLEPMDIDEPCFERVQCIPQDTDLEYPVKAGTCREAQGLTCVPL